MRVWTALRNEVFLPLFVAHVLLDKDRFVCKRVTAGIIHQGRKCGWGRRENLDLLRGVP